MGFSGSLFWLCVGGLPLSIWGCLPGSCIAMGICRLLGLLCMLRTVGHFYLEKDKRNFHWVSCFSEDLSLCSLGGLQATEVGTCIPGRDWGTWKARPKGSPPLCDGLASWLFLGSQILRDGRDLRDQVQPYNITDEEIEAQASLLFCCDSVSSSVKCGQ